MLDTTRGWHKNLPGSSSSVNFPCQTSRKMAFTRSISRVGGMCLLNIVMQKFLQVKILKPCSDSKRVLAVIKSEVSAPKRITLPVENGMKSRLNAIEPISHLNRLKTYQSTHFEWVFGVWGRNCIDPP